MRSHLYARRTLLACALCAGVAACSSSPGSPATAAPPASASSASSAPATTPASSPGASAGDTAAQQTIAANWTAFFDPKESAAKRLSVLQDGQQLAAALKTLSNSSTSSQTSAKVLKVTVLSPTQAKVTYDLLLSGKPVLTNQSGTAVLQNGTWKVGTATLCGLLALNAGGKTSSLPAACKSAG
jgi:hypothetical protein